MSEVSHPRDYNIATSVERDQVAAAIRDIGRPATAREIGDTITYVAFETCDGSQCRGRMESWGIASTATTRMDLTASVTEGC
ncbi:MAG: hypothetical protein HZY75_11935 [Nocardioidaceae bacterium]|nr:MAG: hypothetical protein HZY75_11935 [Nocardioidaceae bacterium]